MEENKLALKPGIFQFCQELERESDLIPEKRKRQLRTLGDYVIEKLKRRKVPEIIVICTHNSRRSHMGQIWLAVATDYFQLPDIKTFSGGTEGTAFNIRAVRAFRKKGFEIIADKANSENPIYQIKWKDAMEPYLAFSKRYEDPPNPTKEFAAIMVCTQADEGCPLVGGCDFRLSLPYDDPKSFDGTDLEEEKYDERVRQIGREMLYVMNSVKNFEI